MDEKQQAMSDLKSVEEVVLGEVAEGLTERLVDTAAEEAIEQVSQSAAEDFLTERVLESGAMRAIPLLGILVGAVSDAAVAEYVGHVAKRAFQERWLRANGKVQFVAPDRTYVRSRLARAESVVHA